MKEVLDDLIAAYNSGDTTAMATVVRTWRSAPRPAGASMLVNASGEAVGSVSGGCIEGAVYEMAGEVIADGVPQFEKYGISNDDAFAVGHADADLHLEPIPECLIPVVRHVQIQVGIAVDIGEGEGHARGGAGESPCHGGIGEVAASIVQETRNATPDGCDEQVQIAVAIEIDQGGSGGIEVRAIDAGLGRNLLEPPLAEVSIESIGTIETAQIEIATTVAIDVTGGDSGAVEEDVIGERAGGIDGVGEGDAGEGSGKACEACLALRGYLKRTEGQERGGVEGDLFGTVGMREKHRWKHGEKPHAEKGANSSET